MDNLDPSLSFGYLINTYDDYIELTESINELNKNLFDDQKVLTVQSEGIEERIKKDMIAKGLGSDPDQRDRLFSILSM